MIIDHSLHNKVIFNQKEWKLMGERSEFRAGEKAPNNGVYMEIGETGSNVNDPQIVELQAGDSFPDNTNKDRVWVNKRKRHHPGVQG